MRHTHFEIRNFKGIEHVRLELAAHPRTNIYTLVGLNESGKTTVLEAIHFLYRPETPDPLKLPGYTISDVHDLIPVSSQYNFTDDIDVTAGYEFDPTDEALVRKHLRQEFGFTLTKDVKRLEITQTYSFKASELADDQPSHYWTIDLIGRTRRGRRERRLPDGSDDWEAATDFIAGLLPTVLYFPNFLFEFPDRIYLEAAPAAPEMHEFYRSVMQDVLDSIEPGLALGQHVLARAKSDSQPAKRALEGVLRKMGGHISDAVFRKWNQMLTAGAGNREIVVRCESDAQERWYLQIGIRDGTDEYRIRDTSLGFRWFLAFILLTQYRALREGEPQNVLFLFDEPASNLHATAQAQLLKSFRLFPASCSIIYTTHSHHMIDPQWLEGTFVVKNEGLEYRSDDAVNTGYSAKSTVITLERYREFASQHPDQSTYFKPVLDVLDYCPSRLENVPDVVMVEGKHDFYTLNYFRDRVLRRADRCNLMPGGGSGSLDDAIRLYLAWGREFIVLLDSDAAGDKEKSRYEEVFGKLVHGRIFTLEDIDATWKGKRLEELLTEEDRQLIQTTIFPPSKKYKFSKTQFNRAIQELHLTDRALSLSGETTKAFEAVFEFFERHLP